MKTPKFKPNTKVWCDIDDSYNTIIGVIEFEGTKRYLLSKDSFYSIYYKLNKSRYPNHSIDCHFLDANYQYHSMVLNYNQIWENIINDTKI